VATKRNGQAIVYLSATKTIGPTSSVKTILASISDDAHANVVATSARYARESLLIGQSSLIILELNRLIRYTE
jgi:hypothetical protein